MQTVRVEVFERQNCAHCLAEIEFLNELQKERGDLVVVTRDLADPQEKALFLELATLEKLPKVTPITLIDGVILQGFDTPATTGKRMRELIDAARGKPQRTFEEIVAAGGSGKVEAAAPGCDAEDPSVPCDVSGAPSFLVSIPFVGPVNVLKYSLPVLSLVLGFVDGFNPCAMWVLVMFLAILLEAGSRRRMFEMAGLFVLAEAVMYYLILNVWMTTWDFVGLNNVVTPIVGAVAVTAGSYFLYRFYKADTSCNVGSLEGKRKTQERLRRYVTLPMNFAVALGILGIAFSVNIIEFACSIGIPQTYTKILDINALTFLHKQFYNFLYILMYMVDDLVIFGLALYSFNKIGLTTHRYTRASHFIGGLLMVILGIILLIKPQWLVFG